MIASLVLKLIGWGVPAKLAKPLLIVFAIAAIVIALGTAKCAYDHNLIEDHDKDVKIEQITEDKKADNTAAEQRRKDDARIGQEVRELEKINASNPDPVSRKREFYRCVRLQQTARANGLEPPACV